MKDSILEEIWRIRDEHAAQFNYDLDAIVEDINRSAAKRDWPRISFGQRRVEKPASTPESVPANASK
jgi:hypothetical protein